MSVWITAATHWAWHMFLAESQKRIPWYWAFRPTSTAGLVFELKNVIPTRFSFFLTKSIFGRLLISCTLYIFSLLLIIFFTFLIANAITDYLNDRVKGEILYIWVREMCVLAIAINFLVLVMELIVYWSTSQYQKNKLLVLLGGEIGNLLILHFLFFFWL